MTHVGKKALTTIQTWLVTIKLKKLSSFQRFGYKKDKEITEQPLVQKKQLSIVYVVIVLSGIILGAFFIFIHDLFIVRTVVVEVAPTSQPVSSLSISTIYDQNLLFISNEKLAASILRINPLVKSVVAEKKYPSTVVFHIDSYRPRIALAVNDGYFILSNEGTIVEKTKRREDSNLPIIRYYQQLNFYQYEIGDRVSYTDILTAVHFVTVVKNAGMPVDTIDISGIDMIVLNSNEKRFIFTTRKDIETQEYQVKTIIRKLKIEGREFVSIDMRFDKPVLKLQ